MNLTLFCALGIECHSWTGTWDIPEWEANLAVTYYWSGMIFNNIVYDVTNAVRCYIFPSPSINWLVTGTLAFKLVRKRCFLPSPPLTTGKVIETLPNHSADVCKFPMEESVAGVLDEPFSQLSPLNWVAVQARQSTMLGPCPFYVAWRAGLATWLSWVRFL